MNEILMIFKSILHTVSINLIQLDTKVETDETKIIKQETQVETRFVNNEDSQNDISDIEVDQKLNENIEFQSTDHNHMVLSKSNTSIDEVKALETFASIVRILPLGTGSPKETLFSVL